jgi:hypothetical protein
LLDKKKKRLNTILTTAIEGSLHKSLQKMKQKLLSTSGCEPHTGKEDFAYPILFLAILALSFVGHIPAHFV